MSRRPIWTAEEAALACTLRREGLTYAEIGEHPAIQRSAMAVKDAFRRNKKVRAEWDGIREQVDDNPFTMSVEDAAALHNIDTRIYYPKKIYTTNGTTSWLKVEWGLNVAEAIATDNFDELLAALREESEYVPQDFTYTDQSLFTGIYIPDAHHGALSWAPETGFDWDLGISIQEDDLAFGRGLYWAEYHGSPLVVLRVGDDLFHYDKIIDGNVGVTAKGTPQDMDGRWQKMFNRVAACKKQQIQAALELGFKVDVVVVPGNHDTQTTYYLGKLLEAVYERDGRVRVDCRPVPRKDYTFGTTTIIHTHGHEVPRDRLADTVKAEFSRQWGMASWFEVHLGHYHHEHVDCANGLTTRIMRALTLNDNWHAQKGYGSTRGAQYLTFHRTEGLLHNDYHTTSDQYNLSPNPRKGSGLRG